MRRVVLGLLAATALSSGALAQTVGAPYANTSPPAAVIFAPGAIGSPPGFVNWGPQSTSQIIRDISNVTVTTVSKAPARWAFIGDSTMAGNCALAGSPCVDSRISSFPLQLATKMQAAGIPTTTDSWFGCSNESSLATCATFDTRLSFGAGWTLLTSQGSFGGEIVEFPASTSPTLMTFVPTQAWNQEDVYIISGTAASSFVFDRAGSTSGASCVVASNNGATTTCSGSTVTTTVGAPGTAKITITWSGSAVTGASDVQATSATTGKFYILGQALRDTSNPKVEIYNGGWGGSTSLTWTTNTGGYSPLYMLSSAAINPTFTFNNLGVNDWNGTTTTAQYKAAMTTLQTQASSTGGNAFIFSVQSNPASFASVATQNQFGSITQLMSIASNEPWINFQYRWTNWQNGCNLGFYGSTGGSCDLRHPSAYGYNDQAAFIMSALRQLVGP